MQGGFENDCPPLGIPQPSLADVEVGIVNVRKFLFDFNLKMAKFKTGFPPKKPSL